MTDLVITNYDNFKDLSYFIGQHKKASEIMKEVNDFYISFLKSKLIYNYDIDKFQGKVIVEKFWDKVEDHLISNDNPDYDKYVKGAYLQDEDGYWFTITRVERERRCLWSCDKKKKEKRYHVKYDVDRPYYRSSYYVHSVYSSDYNIEDKIRKCNKSIESGYFCESTKKELNKLLQLRGEHGERYKLYQELKSLINADNYNSQVHYKQKLVEYIRKYEKPSYYIIDPQTGNFRDFGNEKTLHQYLFKISDDNKYLIVYTENYDGGTRTDRWKTFEYKGRRYDEFWFDVNNGNFVKEEKYFITDWEIELKVHNGWHPYDDD